MTSLVPFDPAAEPDTAALLRRLGTAAAGLLLCSTVIAWGGPDGAVPDRGRSGAVASAPSSPPHEALAAPAPGRTGSGRVGAPFRPGPEHRWSGVLGSHGFASLGDFGDVPPRRAGPTPAAGPATVTAAPAARTVAPAPVRTANDDVFTVVIDPGHGGTDPGSRAPNGLLEKELTADIAARARRFLSELDGIEVLLTREGDTGLSRAARVARIRAARADLVVSLHFNHLPQTDITLVESFYAGAENIAESRALRRAAAAGGADGLVSVGAAEDPDLSFTEGSERLAGLVQRNVHSEVAHHSPNAIDAGIKRDTLFVLTRSEVPGTLVELTCISNPAEAERLESDAYKDRLAAALADAVRDYRASLETRPLGSTDA